MTKKGKDVFWPSPAIIPRSEHPISRSDISPNALKVLYRLIDAGYQAYLVGGSVRDLLLGKHPKDFDVATDARPEQVKAVFRNCRLIGRRFRLAHILFDRETIEVATFRAAHGAGSDGVTQDDGRIIRDNVYGTIEEDAVRRDFTVNALYYNIGDFSVIDFVGATDDLQNHVLRLIGDSRTRYLEDPVRMLRAARLAAKLDFSIHPDTEAAIYELGYLLGEVPPARLFEEVLKLFQTGHSVRSFEMLRRYDLLGYLFPLVDVCFRDGDRVAEAFLLQALRNTDARVTEGRPVTPAFLYAVFLWRAVRERAEQIEAFGEAPAVALQEAARTVTTEQLRRTALPKRFAIPMREIWALQPRLANSVGARALRLLEHPRFRAGYDFFCLRAQVGENLSDRCRWWTELQEKDTLGRAAMVRKQRASSAHRQRRRKRRTHPAAY